jgi:hypothetical protein
MRSNALVRENLGGHGGGKKVGSEAGATGLPREVDPEL